MNHVKRRKKAAAKWRWKVRSVARREGTAPMEVEKMLRKGGERAARLYGAELWCSLRGRGYEEIWRAQMEAERGWVGLSRGTPGCWAREEAGGPEWAEEFWLRACGLVKQMSVGESDFAGKVVRARLEKWAEEGMSRRDGEERPEFDWVGRIMDDLAWLARR